MPKFASAFRITHRFTRSLAQGNFGDLLADGFGTDGGGQIGLEYRFGIMSGTQIGVNRTSDKTIQFFGQQQLFRQREGLPLGLDVIVTIEGRDNFPGNLFSCRRRRRLDQTRLARCPVRRADLDR